MYGDRPLRTVRRACRPAPTSTPPSRCSERARARSSATSPSRSCRSGSRCARPASSGPPSTGSTRGPVVDAVVASAAVPGLLPPAKVGDEHYLDGGIVNSIPVGRAVQLGADPDLRAPGRPDRPAAQAAAPAVGGGAGVLRDRPPAPVRPRDGRAARRRRGARAARRAARRASDDSLLAHRDFSGVQDRIDATYDASRRPTSTSTCEPATVIWALRRLVVAPAVIAARPCCSGSPCRCG